MCSKTHPGPKITPKTPQEGQNWPQCTSCGPINWFWAKKNKFESVRSKVCSFHSESAYYACLRWPLLAVHQFPLLHWYIWCGVVNSGVMWCIMVHTLVHSLMHSGVCGAVWCILVYGGGLRWCSLSCLLVHMVQTNVEWWTQVVQPLLHSGAYGAN